MNANGQLHPEIVPYLLKHLEDAIILVASSPTSL
jgi:hypothetical protein